MSITTNIKPTMSWAIDQNHLNELLVKYWEKEAKMAREALRSKTNQRVLLLSSYCGDNPSCSDTYPCLNCLEMSNVVTAEITIIKNHGEQDFKS